jgi:uncharacterized protein (TIGR03435 family)
LALRTAAIVSVVAIGLLVPPIRAQAPPGFDVASLKESPPILGDKVSINLGSFRHGTLTLTNASLADCLRYAYSLTSNEQLSAPDWVMSKSVRFDIIAKAPLATTDQQVRLMLQTLLTERFHMVMHREQKKLSYVALIVGKKGSKLKEAVSESDASGNKFLIGRISTNRISMTMLSTVLSRFSGETVIDLTGFKGDYEVKLDWTPDNPAAAAAINAPADGPSLFAAVEQQLGLKLDVRKGPVEVLVVDRADKVPVQN